MHGRALFGRRVGRAHPRFAEERYGPLTEIAADDSAESVVYLRFLDAEGRVVGERRLSFAGAAVNDVAAYGLRGVYTLEIVSSHRIEATLRQPFDLVPKRSEADDTP